tara:strand:- start:5901 stop:6578 length:678 start_codon:yes stop_codon:yes gene_type:complete
MKNKLTAIIAALGMLTFATTSYASSGFTVGVSGMMGFIETSGSEHENSGGTVVTTSEITKKDITEGFFGGSIFAEYETDGGWALGIDYVPVDADLGEGKRTDASGSASPGAEDTGDRSASAEMNDLFTYYVTKTLGGSGYYILLGYHDAEITTTETLPASKYGDVDLNGYQYGIGFKTPVGADGAIRYEFSFSDFDDIAITDSTNSKNKVTADADAYMIKVGYNF